MNSNGDQVPKIIPLT